MITIRPLLAKVTSRLRTLLSVDDYGALWTRDDLGVIDEVTLSSALASTNLDLTKDPRDSSITLGPCKGIWVVSGGGSLVYVDGVTGIGKTRTLTGLSAGDGGRICATQITKVGTDTSLVIRVSW